MRSLILIIVTCVILLMFSVFISQQKILIGTPIIDRDSDILDEFIQHVIPYLNEFHFRYSCDLLLITRESDKKIIKLVTSLNHPKIILKQVAHYDITKRHNFEHLVNKRHQILNYGASNQYDYVFFIDADILVKPNTLDLLLSSHVDCCFCPVNLHWSDEKVIGMPNSDQLIDTSTLKTEQPFIHSIIGGFGCTLISKEVFNIPLHVLSKEVTYHGKKITVTGEDIGFYEDCISQKNTTACLLHHNIEHKCHRDINICVTQ